MFDILTSLLSDKTGGLIFQCFDLWHIGYVLFFAGLTAAVCLFLRKRSAAQRTKVINTFVCVAFGLYMLDFFLMPFAYGEIQIEKLPFHGCTAMCVMCFMSRYNRFLRKFKLQFAMLGLLCNITYLLYPAGVMWVGVHPLSYRVVQTLCFHGVMTVYCILVLIFEREEFRWKDCYRDLIVIVTMTVWALLGNTLYSHEGMMHNWFFVVQDPLSVFPAQIAPIVMPFLNIVLFFGVELLTYLLLTLCFKRKPAKSRT